MKGETEVIEEILGFHFCQSYQLVLPLSALIVHSLIVFMDSVYRVTC